MTLTVALASKSKRRLAYIYIQKYCSYVYHLHKVKKWLAVEVFRKYGTLLFGICYSLL